MTLFTTYVSFLAFDRIHDLTKEAGGIKKYIQKGGDLLCTGMDLLWSARRMLHF